MKKPKECSDCGISRAVQIKGEILVQRHRRKIKLGIKRCCILCLLSFLDMQDISIHGSKGRKTAFEEAGDSDE